VRVNMDSSIATDPRFRILERELGWNRREVAGACFYVWLACYERRSERLSEREANACADDERFCQAMIDVGLAHKTDDDMIEFHGAQERIKFLREQAERGRKGGKTGGKSRGSRRQANAKANAKRTPNGVGSERLTNSPALAPDLSPAPDPDQRESASADKPASRPGTEPAARDFAEQAIEHLNAKTGRAFRVGDAVLADCRKLVRAGHTAEQARSVIDAKVSEWSADERMAAHLKPATLLRPSNFRKYLDNDVGTGCALMAPGRGASAQIDAFADELERRGL
jgi:uncharacterized phage protein (TIGR02220 family)